MRFPNQKHLVNLMGFIFPVIKLFSENSRINERIRKIDLGEHENLFFLDGIGKYSFEEITPLFESTLETKKSLEEKAQNSLITIAISASLILGAAGRLLDQKISPTRFDLFNFIFIILAIGLILNVALSGILSLRILSKRNEVYRPLPEDSKKTKEEQARALEIDTEQNNNLNLIRDNYVFSSFRYLLYSIVLLSLIVLLSIFVPDSSNELKTEVMQLSEKLIELKDSSEKSNKAFDQKLISLKNVFSKYKIKTEKELKNIDNYELKKIEKENKTNKSDLTDLSDQLAAFKNAYDNFSKEVEQKFDSFNTDLSGSKDQIQGLEKTMKDISSELKKTEKANTSKPQNKTPSAVLKTKNND